MFVSSNTQHFVNIYQGENSTEEIDQADIGIFGEYHGNHYGRIKYWEYINNKKPKVVLVECVASGVLIKPWKTEMTAGIDESIELRGWDDREFVELCEKEFPYSFELMRLRALYVYIELANKRGGSFGFNFKNYIARHQKLESLAALEKEKMDKIVKSIFSRRQKSLMRTAKTMLLEKGGPIVILSGLGHVTFTAIPFKEITNLEDEDIDPILRNQIFQTDLLMEILRSTIESNYAEIQNAPEPQWRAQFRETFKDYRVTVLMDRLYAKHSELLNKWITLTAYTEPSLAQVKERSFFNACSNDSLDLDYPFDQMDILCFGEFPGNNSDRSKYWKYINSIKPTVVLVENIASGVRINPWDTEMTAGIEEGIELVGWDDQEFVELCAKELPHSLALSRLRSGHDYYWNLRAQGKRARTGHLSNNYFEEYSRLLSLQKPELEKTIDIGKSTFVKRQWSLLHTLRTTLSERKGPIVVISDYRHIKFTPFGFKGCIFIENTDSENLMSVIEKEGTKALMELVRPEIESYYAKIEDSSEPLWRLQFQEVFQDRKVAVLMSSTYRQHSELINQWADNMAYYTSEA